MKSTARAVIEPGGVLRSALSGPPLTIRRVRGDDHAECRLCLVNSAAGPLAGDEVVFDLTVSEDARARVVSAGAGIAQGRGTQLPGSLRSRITLGERAHLVAAPAPLIVCAGAAVTVAVDITLSQSSTLQWQETLILGRFGEPGGSVTLQWDVTRAASPLLRQRIELDNARAVGWPGTLSLQRVMITTLISDPALPARSYVMQPTAVLQRVDSCTMLATVLDNDAATAVRRMQTLCELAVPGLATSE